MPPPVMTPMYTLAAQPRSSSGRRCRDEGGAKIADARVSILRARTDQRSAPDARAKCDAEETIRSACRRRLRCGGHGDPAACAAPRLRSRRAAPPLDLTLAAPGRVVLDIR